MLDFLNNISRKDKETMKKYYGWDSLNTFLALCALPPLFSRYTAVLSLVLLAVILYRVFSTNTARRAYEKQTFVARLQQLGAKLLLRRSAPQEPYRYFNCPKCGTRLRVPRGKGKIMLTCSVCGHKFKKKS